MYIYLKDNIVWEFVPEENPAIPGVPLEARYPAEFIASLVYVEDTEDIECGYIYDPVTGVFSEPAEPEPEPAEPEPEPAETETETSIWDELDAAYQEGVDSV